VSQSLSITPDNAQKAVQDALGAIAGAASLAELKEVRSVHVGEKSLLSQMNATLKDLPGDKKAAAGKLMGESKASVQQAFETREAELQAAEETARLQEEALDLTSLGVAMGWEIAEGPEVEHEWFNFDALNFDADHPARAMQDTFFVNPVERHLLLRTHTSPVQIRSLLERELPVYVVAPGRVYRTDELDATHTPVFHQIEGIAIDKGLTMAHLRGTLEHLARAMFGPEAKIRLRANYFPFTEPSAELDIWHPTFVGGARWIEWGGCGMVNPRVLRSAGIDPEVYQGFAFGMGIERTLMFRNNVSDMRDMVEGDIRFSGQFGMVV